MFTNSVFVICSVNVENVNQKNSLIHQRKVLSLVCIITIGDVTDIFGIQIFLNPQLFPSGFKNFPVHTYLAHSNRIRLSTRIRWYSDPLCIQSMRNKARNSGGTYALLLLLCRHIELFFGKRLDTNLLRHRIRKCLDSPVHT